MKAVKEPLINIARYLPIRAKESPNAKAVILPTNMFVGNITAFALGDSFARIGRYRAILIKGSLTAFIITYA